MPSEKMRSDRSLQGAEYKWEDKFKRLLLRFERTRLLCFAICGVNMIFLGPIQSSG